MCSVEYISPGADGELNKKLLTQFVPADKKLSLFPPTPISPWGKGQDIVPFSFDANFTMGKRKRNFSFLYGSFAIEKRRKKKKKL